MPIQRIVFENGKAELVIADKLPIEEASYFLHMRVPLTLDPKRPVAEELLIALNRARADLDAEMAPLRTLVGPGHAPAEAVER